MVELPFQAKAITLQELFSRAGGLRIPDFQRPYSWGLDQIRDFWDDLLDAARSDAAHFFGTLLTSPAEHPADEILLILDGQQRLTTFTLTLIALDREFENLDDPAASKRVREGAHQSRERIKGALLRPKGQRRLRLRSVDDHLLGSLVAGNPGDGSIGEAFKMIRELLEAHLATAEDRYGAAAAILHALLQRSVLIHTHCLAQFDPFVMFSTLNATGLPLTATQILRARSLGLVSGLPHGTKSVMSDAWETVERLGEDGDRYLSALLVLRTGERIQSKEIVRRFDSLVLRTKELPKDLQEREDHLLCVAQELDRLAPHFADLSAGRWPTHGVPPVEAWYQARVRLLVKNLGTRQLLPLLMASAASLPMEFREVVDCIERAAFVALLCFDNQTLWGDCTFQLAAAAYRGDAGLEEIRSRIRDFYRDHLGDTAAVFSRRLPEMLRYNGRRKSQIRYFLTTVNDWGFPDPEPRLFPDIQQTWNLNQIHIDHVCARKASGDIPEFERDRLGNLTPLYGPDNRGLSDRPFEVKRAKYKESPLRITRDLSKLDDWDQDALERREAALIRFATLLFCRDL